ncbi:hypothetical protein [Corynebacterium sp. ES2715-CONJ3]|uniref:hypothetical protein n=1 Tax=Corynebacterium sp. ES2715-CONJ3 TaxID=2974028 RepID=UPI00216AA039|nr:hypothetical protein [Corynebacterium sp. ES2715-CONJ3]MCS4491257.1 hypothetical protein [Corynebacterium sp. ES2715-CONJ3]
MSRLRRTLLGGLLLALSLNTGVAYAQPELTSSSPRGESPLVALNRAFLEAFEYLSGVVPISVEKIALEQAEDAPYSFDYLISVRNNTPFTQPFTLVDTPAISPGLMLERVQLLEPTAVDLLATEEGYIVDSGDLAPLSNRTYRIRLTSRLDSPVNQLECGAKNHVVLTVGFGVELSATACQDIPEPYSVGEQIYLDGVASGLGEDHIFFVDNRFGLSPFEFRPPAELSVAYLEVSSSGVGFLSGRFESAQLPLSIPAGQSATIRVHTEPLAAAPTIDIIVRNENGEEIGGAFFDLYRCSPDYQLIPGTQPLNLFPLTTSPLAPEITSASLVSGQSYCLIMTQEPPGYDVDQTNWGFSIPSEISTIEIPARTAETQTKSSPGRLPNTGGQGILPIIAVGFIVLRAGWRRL